MNTFYKSYPDFDWVFYKKMYKDLRIRNEKDAIQHFMKHGNVEGRKYKALVLEKETIVPVPFDDFLSGCQVIVSNSLSHFKDIFYKRFSSMDYENPIMPCIFFGIYNHQDIMRIREHKGIRILIWGGEDINPRNQFARESVELIKQMSNIVHIAISQSIHQSLLFFGFNPILIDFNMTDPLLFSPKPLSIVSNKIYIYNGQKKGREDIYGKSIYESIVVKLPQYDYVYSNELNIQYDKMPLFYSTCLIALRLTIYHDGNSNTTQECEAMNIPIVHNHSRYGLKWNSVDDIVHHILNRTKKVSESLSLSLDSSFH